MPPWRMHFGACLRYHLTMPLVPRSAMTSEQRRALWGDFQTPAVLAQEVCQRLSLRETPASLVEPTCGQGTFLQAGVDAFPSLQRAVGVDINPGHLATARARFAERSSSKVVLRQADFFATDWPTLLAELPEPVLLLGNPPWVTSAAIGVLGGGNLPAKSNFQGRRGLAARTGAANFDISEWMLLHLLEALQGRQATLAMLVKTAVARRVLAHFWKQGGPVAEAELCAIDAPRHFAAAVSASLLVCRMERGSEQKKTPRDCRAACFADLQAKSPSSWLGYREGMLLSDVAAFDRGRHLQASATSAAGDTWRSGIKHDAADVMELIREDGGWWNGLGEQVQVEEECLFPLIKGSELARGLKGDEAERRRLLVPQRTANEDPQVLREKAPQAWAYLNRHAERMARRASSIYRARPAFSIFGVGPYTFAPARVAIAGFARSLEFHVLGLVQGKPVVFDDTCAILACDSLEEALRRQRALHSPAAREFLASQIFWDAKRPITIEVLRRLDWEAVAAPQQV